ncbi:terminase large subunit domain-containing protein [Pedobacter sp. CFBP9032]|uniref:terminase large subunit domain-containing protein n=1 Tax=Pedobacter sp. CFBP9032 TaxID=3096539 RepID=UPI002A6A778F|nr:terminase family protein [Pedobacter sp. CFBP9032]MDY0906582.1 terminase family protein [Pedobacter sp. CFBP9032]
MRKIVKVRLPQPHRGQREVLKALETKRYITLNNGRRWGKSLLCQIISVVYMFQGKSVGYITPTYNLGKKFFDDILKFIPEQTIKKANISDLTIELLNGGKLEFYTGEKLDNVRGSKFHLLIVDEAAYIKNLKDGWEGAMSNALIDYDPESKAIFVSTPRGKDYFYALTRTEHPDWQHFHFSSYDNPHLSKAALDDKKLTLPESIFNQEILAIAGENSSAVVALKYITENTIKDLSTKPTVVYGIDVAKYTDWTVITGLDENGNMSYFDRFQTPNEITKQRIKTLPASTLKVMDSTHGSLGDGIYESLINDGVANLQGFEFTGASKPKLIMEMVLAIEKGELKFNEKTADELSTFEYTYSSTGHIKYSAINGCHDDCVAAIAIANKYRKQVAVNDTYLSRIAFF